MNYPKYIDLIHKGKFDEAAELKNSYIPDVLYKYYCLDRRYKLNDSKLQCLQEGKIYLSKLENFNDPFEGKFIIFDENKLKEKGWPQEIIDKFYSHMMAGYKIGCLSGTSEQNMPMWAYYANNHEGFCVEYQFTEKQKKYIFPVAYEPQRIYGNSIVTHIINGILEMVENKVSPDDMSDELRVYQQILFLSFATKHRSWAHEVEYRIMNPFDDYFPAIPKKIFIGMNCKKKYRKRLKEIGDGFGIGCEVYQMEMSRNTEAFELIRK